MSSTPPPTQTLEAMTEEELLSKAIEYRDLSKRLAADYQNLQKETAQRLTDIRKYANQDLIIELASLLDYFTSAFQAVPEDQRDSSWMKGMQYIQDHLIKILRDHNVEIVDAVGQMFDPHMHEAVGEEASDQPEHNILKQTQAGLKLHDKVIRHAKVVVSTGPDNPDPL